MWSKHVRAWVVATLVVAAGSAPAFCQQQSLRWKFRPGERLNYVVQQDMKMSMDYNGRDIGSTMTQLIDTVWIIRGVDSAGNAQLIQKINRIRLKMDAPQLGHVEYDSSGGPPARKELQAMASVFAELVRAEIETTMSPTGKIVSIRVPPSLLAKLRESPGVGSAGFSEESLQQMFNQSGVIMPAAPVGLGQQWTSTNEVQTPAGRMIFNSMLTYRGMQDYEGGRYARIDLKPSVRMVADPKSPVRVTVQSADGSGAILFDQQRGHVLRTKLSSRMVMDVTQLGQSVEQTIDQSVSMQYVPQQVASNGRPTAPGE